LWLEGSGLAGAIGFLMAGLGNHIVAIVGGLLLVIALVGVAVGIPVADRVELTCALGWRDPGARRRHPD
jgi:hypothetical protein